MQLAVHESRKHNDLARAAVIIARANIDITKRNLIKAVSRLEGALEYNPLNQFLHYFAGKIYWEMGDKVRAGKHFYLLQNTSPQELECVKLFEKSLGNDPVLILRKIYRRGMRLTSLDRNSRERIKMLVNSAAESYVPLPRFIVGLKRNFDKI